MADQIDYEALAKKYGGQKQTATPNYEALAKQYGGQKQTVAQPIGQPKAGEYKQMTPEEFQKYRAGFTPEQWKADLNKRITGEAENLTAAGQLALGGGGIAKVPTGARILAQEMAGAGKEPVKMALAERAKALADSVKREGLVKGIEQQAGQLLENMQQTYQNVKASIDHRWDVLRNSAVGKSGIVLKEQVIDTDRVIAAIGAGEGILAGSPESLKQLVDGIKATGSVDKKMRYLRKIPKDPMTNSTEWGMRSLQDDPDSDSWGGQNVFDVFTKSEGTALDGTKYKDW